MTIVVDSAGIPAEDEPWRALVLPFNAVTPHFKGPPHILGPRAAILGRARIGEGARLSPSSVIRADGHFVQAGDGFHLGARSTVHIAHDLYAAIIGDRVTVGRNAVVHACTIGNDCVVGNDAVVLDGSVVEDGVAIADGSIVFPRSRLAAGQLYAGSPARPVRALAPGEIGQRAAALAEPPFQAGTAIPGETGSRKRLPESVFLAGTAILRGSITAGANASIWYGCELDANGGGISIGLNTNIQDNTHVRCSPGGEFSIGQDSTIGHNVSLSDCRIGDRSLIGIGSVLAAGTIVEDDAFVAAGTVTEPGQAIEGGWLWGKRPAQKLVPLDASKRELIATTITTYCGYAQSFMAAERAAEPFP